MSEAGEDQGDSPGLLPGPAVQLLDRGAVTGEAFGAVAARAGEDPPAPGFGVPVRVAKVVGGEGERWVVAAEADQAEAGGLGFAEAAAMSEALGRGGAICNCRPAFELVKPAVSPDITVMIFGGSSNR